MTLEEAVAITKPHSDRIVAESRAQRFERVLRSIADAHIPDQPASSDVDELTWAKQHVSRLRRMALEVLR